MNSTRGEFLEKGGNARTPNQTRTEAHAGDRVESLEFQGVTALPPIHGTRPVFGVSGTSGSRTRHRVRGARPASNPKRKSAEDRTGMPEPCRSYGKRSHPGRDRGSAPGGLRAGMPEKSLRLPAGKPFRVNRGPLPFPGGGPHAGRRPFRSILATGSSEPAEERQPAGQGASPQTGRNMVLATGGRGRDQRRPVVRFPADRLEDAG